MIKFSLLLFSVISGHESGITFLLQIWLKLIGLSVSEKLKKVFNLNHFCHKFYTKTVIPLNVELRKNWTSILIAVCEYLEVLI